MIKRCIECNTERNYPKNYDHCPMCGGKLEKLSLKDYIMAMYNRGTPVREIASKIHMNNLSVCDVVSKELAKTNEIPNYVQEVYVEQIKPLVSGKEWDGKLKPVKVQLPAECTYETIAYVADMARRARKVSHEEMVVHINKAIREGRSPEEIMEMTGANTYVVEREIVKMIRENGVDATPYVQAEYVNDIVTKASASDWDGKLRTLKEGMPEDCSYLTIKAILAANAL